MTDASLVVSFGVAVVVSTVMSVGGISGAFILLPYQVSVLGFVGPAVTPTNHLYNVVAIPSGVFRYFREGRLLWPLTLVIATGTLPGVVIGSFVRIHLLANPAVFRLFMGGVLLLIGSRLALKAAQKTPATKAAGKDSTPPGELRVSVRRFDWQRLVYEYDGEEYDVFVPGLALITFVIGVIGGAYGVGGGAMIATFLVSIWRLPVHTIAGATLFGTFLTSIVGVTLFGVLAGVTGQPGVTPHWPLGLTLGAGGFVGMYTGARLQRFLPARLIESLLSVVVCLLGASYVIRFVLGEGI